MGSQAEQAGGGARKVVGEFVFRRRGLPPHRRRQCLKCEAVVRERPRFSGGRECPRRAREPGRRAALADPPCDHVIRQVQRGAVQSRLERGMRPAVWMCREPHLLLQSLQRRCVPRRDRPGAARRALHHWRRHARWRSPALAHRPPLDAHEGRLGFALVAAGSLARLAAAVHRCNRLGIRHASPARQIHTTHRVQRASEKQGTHPPAVSDGLRTQFTAAQVQSRMKRVVTEVYLFVRDGY